MNRRNFIKNTALSLTGALLGKQAFTNPKQKMNVLFLIIDDCNTWLLTDPTRYTGKVIAPNIQHLAQGGVLFHNAYTASSLCVPSRTAFLSGVAPWKSGVYQNKDSGVHDSPVLKGIPSLLKTFKDNGYFLARLGKVSHGYDLGVNCDVNMNHSRTPPPPGAPLNGIAKNKGGGLTERDWGPTHIDESVMKDKLLADKAIELLQKTYTKPFFIACGLFHPPWGRFIPSD